MRYGRNEVQIRVVPRTFAPFPGWRSFFLGGVGMYDKLEELREKIRKDLGEVKCVDDFKTIRVQ